MCVVDLDLEVGPEQVEPAEQVEPEQVEPEQVEPEQAERQDHFEEIQNLPLYRVMLYYKYHVISILLLKRSYLRLNAVTFG